jgi:hypothetical protein
MTTKRPHPSNTLYRGECQSFEEAMRLVAAQVDFELSTFSELVRISGGAPITENENNLNGNLKAWKRKALVVLNEYNARKAKVDEEFAVWLRSQNDDEMNDFADALASGDYSGLAI